ncbi:hypothetical protein OFM39_33365, partial [Escherichia coli]|nr:hypothetical protein [Escherichia coli]
LLNDNEQKTTIEENDMIKEHDNKGKNDITMKKTTTERQCSKDNRNMKSWQRINHLRKDTSKNNHIYKRKRQ